MTRLYSLIMTESKDTRRSLVVEPSGVLLCEEDGEDEVEGISVVDISVRGSAYRIGLDEIAVLDLQVEA
jgi:hypothetical protein